MAHSNPVPPLYLSPPRCFTCGKVTTHIQLDFWMKLQNMAGGSDTDLPIRSIGDKDVVERSAKTVEGKILDEEGVFRYCCRRMILSQPKEMNKVPLPRDGFLQRKEASGQKGIKIKESKEEVEEPDTEAEETEDEVEETEAEETDGESSEVEETEEEGSEEEPEEEK